MKSLINFEKLKLEKEESRLKEAILKEDLYLPDTTGLSQFYKKPKKGKANLQSRIQESNKEIDTSDITQALFSRFSNHRFLIDNAYVFQDWESDFITVTESMYVYEIESKMSKSDFNDDFKKEGKHLLLEGKGSGKEILPNKFYYCCPRGMIAGYRIPEYAGLMEVTRNNGILECVTVKEAPFIHKEDVFSQIKDTLLEKLAWRYRDIRLEEFQAIKELTGRL
jgi:hypothetical protein